MERQFMSFEDFIASGKKKLSMDETCKMQNSAIGVLNLSDGYDCKECKNKGFLFKVINGSICSIRCKCQNVRKSIWLMKKSGLEGVAEKLTFETFIPTTQWQANLLEQVKSFVECPNDNWLYLGGQSGSGKTHLCTAAAIKLLHQGNTVRYMLWREEATRLKALVNKEDYFDEIEEYKSVDILYIDDLFKIGKAEGKRVQRPTIADINLAFEIIGQRCAAKKKTIISSECSISDLVDLDEAIAGRIKQMCGSYCINISEDINKNYRLR